MNLIFNTVSSAEATADLDPLIGTVLSRDELPAGLKELKGRHVRGKLIVHMQEEF